MPGELLVAELGLAEEVLDFLFEFRTVVGLEGDLELLFDVLVGAFYKRVRLGVLGSGVGRWGEGLVGASEVGLDRMGGIGGLIMLSSTMVMSDVLPFRG